MWSEDLSRAEAEEKHHDAFNEWEDFKKNAEKERGKELLELCPSKIIIDVEISQKRRKKAVRTIKSQESTAWFWFSNKTCRKRVKYLFEKS